MMLDRHLWQSSSSRHLDPLLRELAMTRTGWTSESQFVYSQHRKVLRRLGVADDKIDSVPFWSSASCYSDVERAVLGYADDLVLGGGRVADERFAQLRASLTDVAIFELTYMICTYQMSSVMCRALHLEYDDREDLIVEVVTEHS
jgi:alkylhydroperoxidase family enzyme